ncbi:transcription factor GTE12-like [Abrus precatorius]|uniref:Transcription factor GTE12-like n=1 Tax=Abrus precatorius TaxID=3816 RepID=A0A8B8L7D9_ABRPR|nr:transcription factor GTE12-like [Abrus precatorius]
MAEPQRRKLIIKLILPRSLKRAPPSEELPSSHDEKRMKVSSPNPLRSHETTVKEKSETKYSNTVKETSKFDKTDSRIVSEEQELKHKKKFSDSCDVTSLRSTITRVPTKGDTEFENSRAGSRISRTRTEEKGVRVECNKEEGKRPRVVQHVMMMDRCKKMQCWVMLKRLMVGRDGWAFKQLLLDHKVLNILNHNREAMRKPKSYVDKCKLMKKPKGLEGDVDKCELKKKPIGLEDIESKLKKWVYLEPDEFANDIRLVFSYALQYPPRSEVHKVARRLSDDFEVGWKTLKEKWAREDRERKKNRRNGPSKDDDDDGEVHVQHYEYPSKRC